VFPELRETMKVLRLKMQRESMQNINLRTTFLLRVIALLFLLSLPNGVWAQEIYLGDESWSVFVLDKDGHQILVKKKNDEVVPLVNVIETPWNSAHDKAPIDFIIPESIDFSSDKTKVYFLTKAWETSHALHSVNIDGTGYKYLTDAIEFKVIDKGEYKDKLVVLKHIYPIAGSAIDLWMLFDPEKKQDITIFSSWGDPIFEDQSANFFDQ
jgi:hypothetical protein